MERKSSFLDAPLVRKLTPLILYLIALAFGLDIIYSGRAEGLFPMPQPGTDQLSMLQAAAGLCHGVLPPEGYMYSPAYTLFLALMAWLCDGDLLAMRILQCAICALIPALIYKTGTTLRLGRESSIVAALLYCLYGPAQLIAVDFLREAMLGLCFLSMVFLLASATLKGSPLRFAAAGFFAALCILGRENFIPVVLIAPLPLLFWKGIRRRLGWNGALSYLLALAAPILAIAALNYFRFNHFAIIPGHVSNVMGAYHGAETASLASALPGIPLQMLKFISSYEIPNSLSFYAHRDLIGALKALFITFNLLCALAAVGLSLGLRRPGAWLLASLSGAYAGSMLFFEMFYRFRIPDVPLIALLAGFGLMALLKGRQSMKLRLAISALAIAFFLFTWQNSDSMRPLGERVAVVNILIDNGHFEAASAQLEKLKELGIDTSSLTEKLRLALDMELSGNANGR